MILEKIQALIDEYGVGKLHALTGISRSHLYGIQKGKIEPRVSTLEKIAECKGLEITFAPKEESSFDLNVDSYFRWSLAFFGAPIYIEQQFNSSPDINKLLIHALEKGRRDAEINTVLPIFIYKNWKNFNWDDVLENTLEKAYLGYLLNLVVNFENVPEMAELYSKIYRQHRPTRVSLLVKKSKVGKYEMAKLEKVDNIIAKTWKFKTLDTLEMAKNRFLKWA